jgi:hypothetical protein
MGVNRELSVVEEIARDGGSLRLSVTRRVLHWAFADINIGKRCCIILVVGPQDTLSMTLQETAALAGLMLGTAGSVLGVMNYLRDRAKVRVTLQWDMSVTDNPAYDSSKKWGVVTITNTGRRPVYVSHVALRLPKGSKRRVLLLRESVSGEKLGEGDRPKLYVSDQSNLGGYTKRWRKVYAEVTDSTGRVWRSRHQKWQTKPSWAVEA